MRKARFLAFLKRTLVPATLASGLAFAGPGCHQHYHYYNSDPCAPGTPVASTMRSGSICDPQTSIVDGGTTVADGTLAVDDGHRRTVEVAARRRERAGQLVAILLVATLGRRQPGDDQRSGLSRRCEG